MPLPDTGALLPAPTTVREVVRVRGRMAWPAASVGGMDAVVGSGAAGAVAGHVRHTVMLGEVIVRDDAFRTKEDTRCQVEMEQARAAWGR